MNHYELTLILNPDLASKFDPYKEHFESVLSQLGFNIHYCENVGIRELAYTCLLYTSPSPRDLSTSRMPSSA